MASRITAPPPTTNGTARITASTVAQTGAEVGPLRVAIGQGWAAGFATTYVVRAGVEHGKQARGRLTPARPERR